MKIRQFPFLDRWRDKMLTGQKTATSRRRVYGQHEDVFEAFNTCFEITSVSLIRLEDVAIVWWREEGCTSTEDFRRIWQRLHSKTGYVADRLVYLHRFRRVL